MKSGSGVAKDALGTDLLLIQVLSLRVTLKKKSRKEKATGKKGAKGETHKVTLAWLFVCVGVGLEAQPSQPASQSGSQCESAVSQVKGPRA